MKNIYVIIEWKWNKDPNIEGNWIPFVAGFVDTVASARKIVRDGGTCLESGHGKGCGKDCADGVNRFSYNKLTRWKDIWQESENIIQRTVLPSSW